MKLAISNIAWEKDEEKEVIPLLVKNNVHGIEIALTKIWDNPLTISPDAINRYKKLCHGNDLQIVALQALLFNHPEFTIFENTPARKATIQYLSKILEIGSHLGAKVAVFGSPSNRRTFGLSKNEIEEISLEFFSTIGGIGKNKGIFFCVEANPQEYGTDFINTSLEALELVQRVNHPYFKLHLDSGAMKLNTENTTDIIKKAIPHLKHFHISEAHLSPIHSGDIDHKRIAKALRNEKYNNWVSIEMRSSQSDSNLLNVKKTLEFVKKEYNV